MANAISAIHPYWHEGLLVFDDASKGLDKEPFVQNADSVLWKLACQTLGVDEDSDQRFTVLFSSQHFRGATASATLIEEDCGGHVYAHDDTGETFWLCPALLCYFEEAPDALHVQIKEYAG